MITARTGHGCAGNRSGMMAVGGNNGSFIVATEVFHNTYWQATPTHYQIWWSFDEGKQCFAGEGNVASNYGTFVGIRPGYGNTAVYFKMGTWAFTDNPNHDANKASLTGGFQNELKTGGNNASTSINKTESHTNYSWVTRANLNTARDRMLLVVMDIPPLLL